MKKLMLFTALAGSLFLASGADAQVRVNVNLGGGRVYTQPAYENDMDYYYMPEIGAYYNVSRRLYVYQEGGRWVSGRNLPDRYRGYSYNRGRSVRIRERSPFMHDETYRSRYGNGRENNWNGNHNGWSDRDRRDGGHREGDRRDDGQRGNYGVHRGRQGYGNGYNNSNGNNGYHNSGTNGNGYSNGTGGNGYNNGTNNGNGYNNGTNTNGTNNGSNSNGTNTGTNGTGGSNGHWNGNHR